MPAQSVRVYNFSFPLALSLSLSEISVPLVFSAATLSTTATMSLVDYSRPGWYTRANVHDTLCIWNIIDYYGDVFMVIGPSNSRRTLKVDSRTLPIVYRPFPVAFGQPLLLRQPNNNGQVRFQNNLTMECLIFLERRPGNEMGMHDQYSPNERFALVMPESDNDGALELIMGCLHNPQWILYDSPTLTVEKIYQLAVTANKYQLAPALCTVVNKLLEPLWKYDEEHFDPDMAKLAMASILLQIPSGISHFCQGLV